MDDKDRGPDRAGLKKLCTMAKAILPPSAQSPIDNDLEMHTLEKDIFPQELTETASATDINYYVEKEKIPVPKTGKPAVSTKRRTTQNARATGNAFEIKPTHENDYPASECPVDLLNNDANSSTVTQGNKRQSGEAITSIGTKASNRVVESTAEENVEGVAAIAKEKYVATLNSKKHITNKSVQNIPDIKSSSMGTVQKQQTRNKSTINMKPPVQSGSIKIDADAPKKKNVGESDNKVEDSTPRKKAIPRIGKPIVNKPKPLAKPNTHEYSTGQNKKTRKLEDTTTKVASFSEEGSHTSHTEISTDDDSGASMQVQFSWDGAMAPKFAIGEECSSQSYENEKSYFSELSLEDVKDLCHSNQTENFAIPVESDDSINALLAPRCARRDDVMTKTPIETFLNEKDISDIVSTKKKTQNARAKYVSRPDSVFTIDTTWATAPNVIFDIDTFNQGVRPATSPGRINAATGFGKQKCQDLTPLLLSDPHSDENQFQEQKMRSADWSRENSYTEAPELYSVVIVNPVTPSHEIETDSEIGVEEPGTQNVHDTTHDLEKTENPKDLQSTQTVCPEPHSPNKEDPSDESLVSENRLQPSNNSIEAAKDQNLDYLGDKTASPTRTVSPGIFWNFFQIVGSVLNIFRPSKEEMIGNSSTDKVKDKQTENGAHDNHGLNASTESCSGEESSRYDEKDNNSTNNDNIRTDSIITSLDDRNENGNRDENCTCNERGSGNENSPKRQLDVTSNPSMERATSGQMQPTKYPYKDLFTCFTNTMYWCGICPNKLQQPVSSCLRIIFQILAAMIIALSIADSITMIKVFGIIFLKNKELHDLVAFVFFVGHAATKAYFLFMVTFRWETLTAFVPMHTDIMNKCCDNITLETESKNNEIIGNVMSILTIISALTYALVSKIDLFGNVVTLEKNLRVNAAATDVLVFLWHGDQSGNSTQIILNHHVNDDIMSYETAAKGAIGEGMEFAGEAHDSLMLNTIFGVVFCLRLTTLIVVKHLKRAVPEGQDPVEFTKWQWMIYSLLRLLTKTINCTFGIIWLLMHYRNLVMIANFCIQIVWEPGQVGFWFQGSDIAKLAGIYYLGVDTFNQNSHIKKWIRGVCSGKTEIELGGKVHNVTMLIDDVEEHPIGFGVGRSFINNDFIFGVIEKVSSFFIMLVSFRQKPCECEKICETLAKTFADTLKTLGKQ